jgi:CRISPR-associated endonuclease/helicase Cas3
MLDVGAVAQIVMAQTGFGPLPLQQACAALITLHDLGKFSHSFRAMIQEGAGQRFYHWEHTGDHLWRQDIQLAQHLGGSDEARRILVEAISGHHGGPRATRTADELQQQRQQIGADAIAAADQVLDLVFSLFPDASLEGIDSTLAKTLSWHLNGLTVQSDWIGSNPDWFPPAPPDIPLLTYWAQTQKRAVDAVAKAGLFAASPAISDPLPLLNGYAPRPLQAAALAADLPEGPVLSILEDSTGAGKTEAGLILAKRMMQAGKGSGVFLALPTMATANAMLPRLERAAAHLFDTAPTLALSHGRAQSSDHFRRIQARDGSNPETGPHCGSWLAEDRRLSLLADLGVGTIDQALFGVLPTRFNGLRLRALSQRILIVDEAHDYDPYMQAELERLLQMQARMGGSAIVMTATLPGPKKRAFEKAFQLGLKPRLSRWDAKRLAATAPTGPAPYPALTTVSAQVELTAVNAASSRTVQVNRLSHMDQAVELIVQAQQQGAACIWIRNAVDDAIAAVSALRARGIAADLLHARFALCDRLDKEADLLGRFGPEATQQDRAGRVLVATQVAEQSLDLDFDVMVSDLAPIGAMIQRAGRLWRHMAQRPADTRPGVGTQVGPVLHILSPDPGDVRDDNWLQQVLDRGAYTYDVSLSWRSAAAVFAAGQISSPAGLRDLIEAVEGDTPLPLPETLEQAGLRKEGENIVERGMARNALIDTHDAFDQAGMAKIWDDEQFPTRLGVEQVTVALATRAPDGLQPLAEATHSRWSLSEVQISRKRFEQLNGFPDQEQPEIAAIKEHWSEARAAYVHIAPLDAEGQICEGLRYDRDSGIMYT